MKKTTINRDKQIRKVYDKTDKRITWRQFKARTLATQSANDGITARAAAKKVANSSVFTTASERSRENLLNAMKKEFNPTYQELHKLARNAKGQFISLKDSLLWDKDRNGYTVNTATGLYFIDTHNSPKFIDILKVS